MSKFLLKMISVIAIIMCISVQPVITYAQESDLTTTTEETTNTTEATDTEEEGTKTDKVTTKEKTSTTETTKKTEVPATSNVSSVPTKTSASTKSSIRDYLPYILIAGSVILLVSIIGILLSGKKSAGEEEVINITPQPTMNPETNTTQTVVTDMSNIPENLTNQTKTDNITGATPQTLGDIVSNTSTTIPSATMEQVQPVVQTPTETVVEQNVTAPMELPQSQPEFPTSTVIEETPAVNQETTLDTPLVETPVQSNITTQTIEQPTIANPVETVPLVEPITEVAEQPVITEPAPTNPAESVPVAEPTIETPSATVSNPVETVPLVEPVAEVADQAVMTEPAPTNAAESIPAVEPVATTQVTQDQAAADLQALISGEVNNISTQQSSTPQNSTNVDDDLPQVPPMM